MNVKAPSTSSPLRWIPITGLLLLLLVWSWANQTGRVGYRGMGDAPPGSHQVLSLFTVTEVSKGSYRLARGQLGFDVVANTAGLTTGEEITAGVRVSQQGELIEEWRVPAPGRQAKRQLGFFGMMLTVGIAFATLRFTPRESLSVADLVTHLCSVLIPGTLVPHRAVGLVAVGSVLPDALGRVVPMALEVTQGLGAPVPDPLIWAFGAFHSPAGLLLTSGLFAQSFLRGQRIEAFTALTLGCAAHLLVDVLQFHHGRGYPLLAPFSWETWELGLIGSEATVDLALPLLGVTAVLWAIRGALWWSRRQQPEVEKPS